MKNFKLVRQTLTDLPSREIFFKDIIEDKMGPLHHAYIKLKTSQSGYISLGNLFEENNRGWKISVFSLFYKEVWVSLPRADWRKVELEY